METMRVSVIVRIDVQADIDLEVSEMETVASITQRAQEKARRLFADIPGQYTVRKMDVTHVKQELS